eukprot:gene13876-13995_t
MLPVIYIILMLVRFVLTIAFRPLFIAIKGDMTFRECIFVCAAGLRGSASLIMGSAVVTDQLHGQGDVTFSVVKAMMVFWTAGFVLLTLLINAPLLPAVLRVTGLSEVPEKQLARRRRAVAALGDHTATVLEQLRDAEDELLAGVDWAQVAAFVDHGKKYNTFTGRKARKPNGMDDGSGHDSYNNRSGVKSILAEESETAESGQHSRELSDSEGSSVSSEEGGGSSSDEQYDSGLFNSVLPMFAGGSMVDVFQQECPFMTNTFARSSLPSQQQAAALGRTSGVFRGLASQSVNMSDRVFPGASSSSMSTFVPTDSFASAATASDRGLASRSVALAGAYGSGSHAGGYNMLHHTSGSENDLPGLGRGPAAASDGWQHRSARFAAGSDISHGEPGISHQMQSGPSVSHSRSLSTRSNNPHAVQMPQVAPSLFTISTGLGGYMAGEVLEVKGLAC